MRRNGHGFGRLPVVARDDPKHLVGLIQRRGIVKAYNLGLTKRAEIQHRTRRMQMRNIDGTEFIDLVLNDESSAVGKSVGELAEKLPNECILISIRRNGKVLIPHGQTELQSGDQITAFIQSKDTEKLYQCLHSSEE